MPLSDADLKIASGAGIEADVAEIFASQSGRPLEHAMGIDDDFQAIQVSGLSVSVKDGDEAERLMNSLRPLLPEKYRAYWSFRHDVSGMHIGDEVVIVPAVDGYEMLRLRQTSNSNNGVMTEEIISQWVAWKGISGFDVVGADHDWVALQFSRLPDDLCGFCEEIHAFCPDTVESQGGSLGRKADRSARLAKAMQLCPDVSKLAESRLAAFRTAMGGVLGSEEDSGELAEFSQAANEEAERGIRALALDLREKNYVFLWWD